MSEIIPFGKYKGQPIDVLQSDKDYANWLLAQAWFCQRFDNLRTVIINNFGESDDSPEHNAMQARYLDKSLAFNTLLTICGDENLMLLYKHYEERPSDAFSPHFHASLDVEFEKLGWDVAIKANFYIEFSKKVPGYYAEKIEVEYLDWNPVASIELKPMIGDDFMAILRAVKSRNTLGYKAVITDEFSSSAVSYEDAKSMFHNSGVTLLTVKEIKAFEIPAEILKHAVQ